MSMTNFYAFCQQLALPFTYEKKADLEVLEKWCHEHVSHDILYQGQPHEKYSGYLGFIENYLDNFIAHLPTDLAEKIPYYGNLNAIHYAAQQGYEHFIHAQASLPDTVINEADNYGFTPLHKAALQGHYFTVKALLAKGANPQLENTQKQLPIQSALFVPIAYQKNNLDRKQQIVRALLPLSPAALSRHDKDGNTLMHLAVLNPFDELINDLVKAAPKLPFIKNTAGLYPIHTAILNQQAQAVDKLLAIDKVATLTDGHENLPLHYAARYGIAGIVTSCCKATTDVNCLNGEGRTPLLEAVYAGNEEALTPLLLHGADPTLTDSQGSSILHIAVKAKNESIIRWILDNIDETLLKQMDKDKHTPLFYANKNNDQRIETLLNGKVPPNQLSK